MAGTVEGGKRAAATNKAKYGADFYAVQGAKGGKAGNTGGFYGNRELARRAGAKGGAISRRGKRPRSEWPTHCVHGHEYTPDNTTWINGRRYCVACQKARMERYYQKQEAKRAA